VFAHPPEVVVHPEADDPVVAEAGDLLPQIARSFVRRDPFLTLEVGEDHAILRELQLLREKIPREDDGLLLEVIAEAEVAQHLEEGVMPRRGAHVLEVVVLAADAHALLRRGGALVRPGLPAREHILELDHPRVRE